MAKRLPAAQHHFRPPAAPAAYSSTLLPAIGYRSSGWLPNDAPLLSEPIWCTGWPAPSRLAQEECMRMRFNAASSAASPPSTAVNVPHRVRVPQAAVDAFGRQVLRPPYWSRPKPRSGRSSAALEFGAEDCMRRLCGTPPAGWVLHPRTGPSRARRGAESAVFRPPRGRRRARPRQARALGHPSRSSRPAPGSWAWLYSAYIALVSLDARNAPEK